MEDSNVMKHFSTTRMAIVVAVLIILLFIFKPFTIVGADERGLRFTMGELSDEVIQPGLAWKIPLIQSIECVSIRPLELPVRVTVDENGAITKDNQTIGAELTLFYRYVPEYLPKMWRQFGKERLQSILNTTLRESFKAGIGTYNIFELPVSQDKLRGEVTKAVKEKMASYDVVAVTELKITNYDWSEDFDNQIKETMRRAQQVKQKEQELLITENEAKKKVKEAEANKQARITEAEGMKESSRLLADAKALDGEGIRKYNEAVQKNMALEIELRKLEIEKIKAQQWNGQYVPTNNYGPIPVTTGQLQPSH